MHHRPLRILLLLLATVWYAAVLPGHQRGVVQLPGGSGASSPDACCEPGKSQHPGEPAPARSPVSCAVCQYMGALSFAPPIDLGIAPLGPTDRQPAQPAPAIVSVRALPTYLGRAPPAI